MRLLIALWNSRTAEKVQSLLYAEDERWEIDLAGNGRQALALLRGGDYGLLLLHSCLPEVSGTAVLQVLSEGAMLSSPRVLYLCEREMLHGPLRADCVAPICAAPEKLARLLTILAQKPLPALAAVQTGHVAPATEAFLHSISMRRDLKGRAFIAWLLERFLLSSAPEGLNMGGLYGECARCFATTPAAVERCVRVAVESVFTEGSIGALERYFGATVDPERGKPTNRAFLLQASQQLRLLLYGSALGEQQRQAP